MKLFSKSVCIPVKCGSYTPNFIKCCRLKYIVNVLRIITIIIKYFLILRFATAVEEVK